MFNILRSCRNTVAIADAKAIHYPKMSESDIDYLSSIPDEQQYPAARCAMNDGVIMYSRSSTASVESMNRANMRIRERTAVDLINACILLIKMEAERFEKKKAEVWSHDRPLTPRGLEIVEEIYKDVNHREYLITVTPYELYSECKVRRNVGGSSQTVKIMTTPFETAPAEMMYYGSCSCGAMSIDGAPCHHFAAVIKSGRVTGAGGPITMMNAMPRWWSTSQWKFQYPQDEVIRCGFDIEYLKEKYPPDSKIRYCPDLVAPRKTGRPPNGKRIKGAIEVAMERKKNQKEKTVRVRAGKRKVEEDIDDDDDGLDVSD